MNSNLKKSDENTENKESKTKNKEIEKDKKSKSKIAEKQSHEEKEELLISELKSVNKSWVKNPYLFWIGLIAGPAWFVGALYVPLESTLLSWIQAIFFFLSVGFSILPLSYLFNLLWIQLLKKQEEKRTNQKVEE
ncbi:MAG: hypothetical protein K9W46_01185 [Candidatus Heimdallarchaeum endolithica]|uniref:Uncharacterized protein n=1 Tax=Candidatus Heimdallarchaeum endolithica TaxID=2876572 RepID=A0A9Y1FPL5_9ARCH|nr:MAG: hypothetical protein K9W46_01185 [Candidatus Heimdallarchaeum endolithica]